MKKCLKINLKNEKQIKEFCNINAKSECDIDVEKGRGYIDGKSILGVLSLNLMKPIQVFLFGDDERIEELENQYKVSDLIFEG
ncbi:hypothetical protein SAMN05216390_13915 [Lachnospiraceae bacterium KH1T2]|nr:hypothetical protein SAMN05216390_13915 [Lachnospiraceae bacterium KH1T2]